MTTEAISQRQVDSGNELPEISCELMIIGTGMAGMAAAMFAANQGVDTVHVGMAGELNFASGLLDLMGVYPVEQGNVWDRPWDAIDALIEDTPSHPYARLNRSDMEKAIQSFMDFLTRGGLTYECRPDTNVRILTPVGTTKPTYGVPGTMIQAVQAMEEKAPCMLVDFHGLKGFSGKQILAMWQKDWPDLQTVRLKFPDSRGEVFAEHMARALEMEANRDTFARLLRPHIRNVQYVGLPAILGIYQSDQVFSDLQQRLGCRIFEIPIMPPCVTGLRIRHVFEQRLPVMGVKSFYNHQVIRVDHADNGDFIMKIGPQYGELMVRANAAILASGRFFGKGLHANRHRITETIFNLPVHQPQSRDQWHNKAFFAPTGHPLNRAGLEIDAWMRPVDAKGQPVYSNLFAAGSILAHQDWMRMKCGSGLAITTAHAAVKGFHSWRQGKLSAT